MARVTIANTECGQALPLGQIMLKKQTERRLSLGLPWNVCTYQQGEFSVQVRSSEFGDTIDITGGYDFDILFLERVGNKKVAVYGYDLKNMTIQKLGESSLKSLIKVVDDSLPVEEQIPIIDTTDWLDEKINFGLRAEVNRQVALIAIDTRLNTTGLPVLDHYRGIVGEGKIKSKGLRSKTWDWGEIADVPDLEYPNDTILDGEGQPYPYALWPSPIPPHVSTQKHVTKNGLEIVYSTEWYEDLGGVGNTIRARWFIRDLKAGTPWELLFDLSIPQRFYNYSPTAEIQFLPHNFDNRNYAMVTESTIYMRIKRSGTYQSPIVFGVDSHEWWTLFREFNEETQEWGPWDLFYDGDWASHREDGSIWSFRGMIFDPLERFTGYVEWNNPLYSDLETYVNKFRVWIVQNGNPMTSPSGYIDINVQEDYEITMPPQLRTCSLECWAMTENDTLGFLLTSTGTDVRDVLFTDVSGVRTTIYSPPATRRLGTGNARVITRDGRYYMGQEVNRVNPTGDTNDIILVDMVTKKKTVLNRTPAYTQFFGRNIVWPFSFVEPMRKL